MLLLVLMLLHLEYFLAIQMPICILLETQNNSVYQLFSDQHFQQQVMKKKNLVFRRLIRGGALKALQANSTASAIIGDSQTATDEINSL